MGGTDEIGQLKPVKCTYPDCEKRYDTIKEMQNHKRYDPNHHYCKKCDVDCEDWSELTQHKVDAMQPWLDGRMRGNKDENPKHIVCEFCGQDFKSFGGRRIHREEKHQADQSLVCPGGCKAIFIRAGDLLAHLESGSCEQIPKQKFLGHVQQKHITEQMMVGWDSFQSSILQNKLSKERQLEVDPEDGEEGGVDLIDLRDGVQKLALEPENAESGSTEKKAEQSWPFLPGLEPRKSKVPTTDVSLAAKQVSSGYAQGEATKKPWPAAGALGSTRSNVQDEYYASSPPATRTDTSSTKAGPAWTTGQTSKALFEERKPASADWEGILSQQQAAAAANDSTNLFRTRFYDPHSEEYNVEMFYNYDVQKYCCPFEGCEDVVYNDLDDLQGHFQHAHLKTHYTCPLCFKRFKTGSALISHSEAAGKCKVKKSTVYGKLLDEVSGGFLKAEHLNLPKIAKGEQIEVDGGLMATRFKAKLPEED